MPVDLTLFLGQSQPPRPGEALTPGASGGKKCLDLFQLHNQECGREEGLTHEILETLSPQCRLEKQTLAKSWRLTKTRSPSCIHYMSALFGVESDLRNRLLMKLVVIRSQFPEEQKGPPPPPLQTTSHSLICCHCCMTRRSRFQVSDCSPLTDPGRPMEVKCTE